MVFRLSVVFGPGETSGYLWGNGAGESAGIIRQPIIPLLGNSGSECEIVSKHLNEMAGRSQRSSSETRSPSVSPPGL